MWIEQNMWKSSDHSCWAAKVGDIGAKNGGVLTLILHQYHMCLYIVIIIIIIIITMITIIILVVIIIVSFLLLKCCCYHYYHCHYCYYSYCSKYQLIVSGGPMHYSW